MRIFKIKEIKVSLLSYSNWDYTRNAASMEMILQTRYVFTQTRTRPIKMSLHVSHTYVSHCVPPPTTPRETTATCFEHLPQSYGHPWFWKFNLKKWWIKVCFFFYDFIHVKWNQIEAHSLQFIQIYHRIKFGWGNIEANRKRYYLLHLLLTEYFFLLVQNRIPSQWPSSISVYSSMVTVQFTD